MDENQEALNREAEEINSRVESPTTEKNAPEDVVEAEPTGDVETTETEGEPKKGAATRIRELNQKAKLAEEKAKSLEEKLAELTGSSQPGYTGYSQQFSPQEPIVADGEEITAAELNRRIAERDAKLLQAADARSELRFKQNEAINRINTEANAVIREYPELDPDSESFNKDLSDAITEATEAYVTKNPYSASVKKFVAKLMQPYKGAVAKEVGQASEQIAKQVSQAALRPTSVRQPEKTAKEKSIAELEAELGTVYS